MSGKAVLKKDLVDRKEIENHTEGYFILNQIAKYKGIKSGYAKYEEKC